jgi:hypothetical protein
MSLRGGPSGHFPHQIKKQISNIKIHTMKLKQAIPVITLIIGAGSGYLAGISGRYVAPAAPVSSTSAHQRNRVDSDQKQTTKRIDSDAEVKTRYRYTRLASSVVAEDALSQAAKDSQRSDALRALIISWIEGSTIDENTKSWLIRRAEQTVNQDNSLMSLASILEHSGLAAYREPFMRSFHDSPVRSSMFAGLVGTDSDPVKLAEICREWLPWEKQEFMDRSKMKWADAHPQKALEWARQHPDDNHQMIQQAMSRLAEIDLKSVEKILSTSNSPVERKAAINAMATTLAYEDTRKAVEWADRLPDGPEKDAAHEAIYEETPRGVGAVLVTSPDGLPTVARLIPNGPLSKAGFQDGDMLAGIEPALGGWQGFSGVPFDELIPQLRGEPGSKVTIVGMRRNNTTGQWDEIRRTISREQLILENTNN